ncbi:GH24180 [Drosophila grimshawi]|uniref:GH24180 n=1 Tax=Drosophila grimshawi TaxID=7222 RepID=B4JN92_DROGR|nr:GH24180 [Drosophila grimshawi]
MCWLALHRIRKATLLTSRLTLARAKIYQLAHRDICEGFVMAGIPPRLHLETETGKPIVLMMRMLVQPWDMCANRD